MRTRARGQPSAEDAPMVLPDRLGNPRRHPPGRTSLNLSHWWLGSPLQRSGLTLLQAKTAGLFEGVRRTIARREFSQDWQVFTGLVFGLIERTWPELSDSEQARLISESASPLYVPPAGYCWFPEEACPERDRAAWVPLHLPEDEDCLAAVDFVRRCRQLQDAGMLLGAVNNLARANVRYAAFVIERQPRSVRAADIQATVIEKECERHSDTAARVTVRGHVFRRGRWVPERHFHFDSVMKQLAEYDDYRRPSDFLERIRL